jgi:glyoxylase-like metal-dependent hydrolase (beta-lactamase superfamily II)
LKITDDVYALDSTKKWNYAYLIYGEEKILVDTGRPGQGKGILKELKSISIEPEDIKHILITHHDVDHIGNLAFLEKGTGARIWASKEDIPYIYGDKSRPGHKKIISFFMRVKKPENITAYSEDQTINGVEVIPTPGHTPGHVCLLYKDVLFAGDLVRNSKGQLEPMASHMNWNKSALNESIKKIAGYDFNWICPAHGEPIKRDNTIGSVI